MHFVLTVIISFIVADAKKKKNRPAPPPAPVYIPVPVPAPAGYGGAEYDGHYRRRRGNIRQRPAYGGGFLSGTSDTDICMATNGQFGSQYMAEMIKTMTSDCENAPEIALIAKKMGQWCNAQGVMRRRRVEVDGKELTEEALETIEMHEHLDSVEELIGAENFEDLRRRQCPVIQATCTNTGSFDFKRYDSLMARASPAARQNHYDTKIPSEQWKQCTGYATALSMLTKKTHHARSADVFVVNAKGSSAEKKDGCGSVVNKVNYAISQGKIPGMRIAKDMKQNDVVVIDQNSPLRTKLAHMLTTVTLMTGAVAMKFFEICPSYQKMISIF